MGWYSDSQLCRPACLVICDGRISQGIQFAGSYIFFNLSIPDICIELLIPRTEFGQLIFGQLCYRLFNFFNCSRHLHTSNIYRP
jgi:hypothetical protein